MVKTDTNSRFEWSDRKISAATFICLVACVMLFVLPAKAQIVPEFNIQSGAPYTPQYLIENILVGQGVVTSNIVFTGNLQSIGYFSGESNIGLGSGIILSSGNAVDAHGSASANASTNLNAADGDDDLRIVANRCGGSNKPSNDAAVLEFDFVPQSTFVEFRYVFASEEYPEFVGEDYNDAFGFFISGPGISGFNQYSNDARNIALVPNTFGDLVCINSVNQNTNSAYYTDNSVGTEIKFDGFTHVFIARSPVIPCNTYHIKLSISDIFDEVYDSGVFLEANSFSSIGVQSNVFFTHAAVDTAVENCNSATLEFRLSKKTMADFTLHYEIAGTALNGTDYETIADSVVFPSGDSIAFINIIPITDIIPEETKVVEIIYNSSLCEYIPETARIWIKDYPYYYLDPSPSKTIECGTTTQIYAGINGGIEPYNFYWDTGNPADTTEIIQVSPVDTTTYNVIVTDVCGNPLTASITIRVAGPEVLASDDISICLNESDSLFVQGGTSWIWTPGNFTNDTIIVNPLVTTIYKVVATDDCGNFGEDYVTVYVNEPAASAGNPVTICTGQSTTLIAGPDNASSYVWTDMMTNQTYTGREIIVNPPTSRQYCVDVTDNCGNTLTDCVFVNVFQLTADAGIDPTICAGDQIDLTGVSSTGNGTYSWTDGTNTFTGDVIQVSPLTTTTYTFTVDDGCLADDQVTVNVNQLPMVSAVASVSSICPDDQLTLTASGAVNYTWSSDIPDPTLIGQENSVNPVVAPLANTSYTLTGTDVNGCINAALVGVIVKERMVADFSILENAVCEGVAATITYVGNGQTNATYAWDFGGGASTTTGQGPHSVSWTGTGTRTVSLTVTQSGCVSAPVTNTIEVNAMPVAEFTSGIAQGCVPLTVSFTDNSLNTASGVIYDWNFGSAGSQQGATVNQEFATAGKYDVALTVTNPGGCISQKSMTALVDAWPLPVAAFNADPEQTSMKNPVISFASISTGDALTYNWSVGDGTVYDIPEFTHTYADSGYYQVVLVVSNSYGCTDRFENQVFISPRYMLRVPTAFTPNGDGMNEVFLVSGTGVKEYSISIFNRWGALVFFSDDINTSWDGKVGGLPAERGIYVYQTYFRDENDEISKQKGSINLIR